MSKAKFEITGKKGIQGTGKILNLASLTQDEQSWFINNAPNGEFVHVRFHPYNVGDIVILEFSLVGTKLTPINCNLESAQDTAPDTAQPTESIDSWVSINGAWLPKDHLTLFSALAKLDFAMIGFIGDTGEGKTFQAQKLAESIGYDFTMVQSGLLTNALSPFVMLRAQNGDTIEEYTPLLKALQSDKQVICLDELSRAKDDATNALFSMLDHVGKTTVFGREFVRGHNILVVFTANIGSQYVGTKKLDLAFVDRTMAWFEVTTPPQEILVKIIESSAKVSHENATKIARVIFALKEKITSPVSTRTAINIANTLDSGLPFKDIVRFTLGNKLKESDRLVVEQVINTIR